MYLGRKSYPISQHHLAADDHKQNHALQQLGDARRAIGYQEQALAISREIGDRHGEGLSLSNLGTTYSDLGQVEQAIEHYEQALAIARETGDRRGQGHRLANLGLADTPVTFEVHLDLDGAPQAVWTVTGLPSASWIAIEDHPLVVPEGNHLLSVRLDPTGVVPEPDEDDNTFQRGGNWIAADA